MALLNTTCEDPESDGVEAQEDEKCSAGPATHCRFISSLSARPHILNFVLDIFGVFDKMEKA
jgi:hypothetical protein